jgi:quinol-cytochrome oxidoreductase complex cytochrome b subunit
MMFDGMTPEEFSFVQQATASLTKISNGILWVFTPANAATHKTFCLPHWRVSWAYRVQRFMTDQIGMGIVYFFTAGFCFIGTIVDLINYKSMANEYNQKMAFESFNIAKMSN